MLMENYREATRFGMRGFAQDSIILSNPWGVSTEEISKPVFLWHGEEDANVSIWRRVTWREGSPIARQPSFLAKDTGCFMNAGRRS